MTVSNLFILDYSSLIYFVRFSSINDYLKVRFIVTAQFEQHDLNSSEIIFYCIVRSLTNIAQLAPII